MYQKKFEQIDFQDAEIKGQFQVHYDEGFVSGRIQRVDAGFSAHITFGANDPEDLKTIGKKLIEIAALAKKRLDANTTIIR